VTTWIENPEGGRARGPRAVVRSWGEVLVRPRRFFVTGVGPGDVLDGVVATGYVGCCINTPFEYR